MGASRERKEAEESVAKIEKKDKKDKKDKKEKKDKKRSETDGVHKNKDKSDKKDKKAKKEKLAAALDAHLQASAAEAASVESESSDNEMADAPVEKKDKADKAKAEKPIVRGAIVEFAVPMAADKYQKKVFKIVKQAAKQQALLRGVKEVNKALRKAPPKNPSAASAASVPGVVVIAGDVNPAEVIMHLPLACEDVNAPYVFVASRGELGQAARTKRPTSVVMIKAEGRTSKKAAAKESKDSDDEDEGSYAELYADFVKVTQKEYAKQMKGII